MPESRPCQAYLLLGSNIEPERHLTMAVRELSRLGTVLAISHVWETPPVGCADQPNYLNAGVLLETYLGAAELHDRALADIENRLERRRDPNNPNAPRTIDIDLVLFNRETLTLGRRSIPDPALLTQAFVAIPIAELDPDYIHPQTGKTLREIAGGFNPRQCGMYTRSDVAIPCEA